MTFSRTKFIIILIACVCFAYFSSLGNPFIWDDEQFIQKNVYVQNFDIQKIFTTNTVAGAGVASNYYRPLTSLSFAVESKIWGQNPFGFHVTNLLLHSIAGILLFLLLIQLGMGKWGSFFISLFFLIHPIQTEAVTYINSRGDSLYTLFLFGALLSFSYFLQRKQSRLLFISLFLYVCSLFSKETALVGFLLFPLIFIFQKGLKDLRNKKILSIFILFLSLALGYFLLRVTILNFGNTLNFYGFENEYTRSISIRLLTFSKVVWIYLGLLIFPYPLHMERTVSLVRSIFSPWVLSMISMFILMGVLGFWQRKQKNPWILFGFLWFFIMLIPVSGIVPINGILYEHWLYVPMIGFFICLYGFLKLVETRIKLKLNRMLLIAFAILISVLYIFLVIKQNNIWVDPITFYTYTLSFAPNSARLHNNLGVTLANEGKIKEAISQYQQALRLGFVYPQLYNNLGNAQIASGDYENAEKNLQKALSLFPQFTVAKMNLIKLYLVSKQYDKAIKLAGNDIQLIQLIESQKNAASIN